MYLTSEPIELGPLVRQVHSAERGGIACFVGTVRDHQGARAVSSLDYSAYEAMAEAECARIVSEAEDRLGCSVALQHRIGSLQIGDVAVAVAVAAAHREEAFAGCRFVIEQVKRRVPIWKREYFADGSVEWVGGGVAGQRDSEAADASVNEVAREVRQS